MISIYHDVVSFNDELVHLLFDQGHLKFSVELYIVMIQIIKKHVMGTLVDHCMYIHIVWND